MPGIGRGAGRLKPLAASGPRNRRSSSVSIAVVPRRSTQVTATLENSVSRSGEILAIGLIMTEEDSPSVWFDLEITSCFVGGGVRAFCETTI